MRTFVLASAVLFLFITAGKLFVTLLESYKTNVTLKTPTNVFQCWVVCKENRIIVKNKFLFRVMFFRKKVCVRCEQF